MQKKLFEQKRGQGIEWCRHFRSAMPLAAETTFGQKLENPINLKNSQTGGDRQE
jgi:hypothetical protein